MAGLTRISASAGSGKTYRLTADYIDRLPRASAQASRDALAAAASGILAVTFTNAAANEMRSRVIRRLKETALGSDADAAKNASRWLAVFLSNLNALNIRTIDSLLNQIVRASALDLGISPDYEIAFDVNEALAPHIELILEQARNDGTERNLVRNACMAVLDQGGYKGFLGGDRIHKPLRDVLADTLAGKFDNLSSVDELMKLKDALPLRAASAASRFIDHVEQHGLNWKNRRNLNSIQRYACSDFTRELSKAAQYESAAELFKDAAIPDAVEEAYAAFKSEAISMHTGSRLLDSGRQLKPFIDLAQQVAAAFSNDAQDTALQALIPAWASAILAFPQGVSDSLCRLGSRLTHFLVDEFQDTSGEQWQVLHALVLEALARGGSFTWVGDVKQSIYGWRGGDPRLFDAAASDSELVAVAGPASKLRLVNNWRSLPELVEHANTFFGPLADPAQAAEIVDELLGSDAPADTRQEAASRLCAAFGDVAQKCQQNSGQPGYVAAEEIAGDREALNERLCQLLLDDIGKRRPWSDVLILVRGNETARTIAEKLGENQIPVITENGLLLNENSLVIQTIAFLSFLINPRDDIAFWTYINGSIFSGFSPAFRQVCADLPGWAAGPRKSALFAQFRNDFPEEWRKFVNPFYNQAGLMTAYDTVSEWYRLMEVERRFPEDVTMLRRLLETIHLAEGHGITSVAGFLEYWQENSDKEKAPMPENMNAVRIMTIHKAKGLEAPVVIVPAPEYQIKHSQKPFVQQFADLSVATRYTKDLGKPWYEELTRQSIEALNLFYVACTRAREELYLLYPEARRSNMKNLSAALKALTAKAGWSLPYQLGSKPAAKVAHTQELRQQVAAPSGPSVDEDAEWRPMAWLPRLKIYHAELAASGLTAKQRGTVLHACLEFMNSGDDPEEVADAALNSGLSACAIAVPDSEIPGLRKALVWFASTAPVRQWLAKGWREQPLITGAGEILRADMIVPEEWGPLVIDYKSGDPRPEDIQQIREYMQVLYQSRQFAGRPCGLLVYLDKQRFKKVLPQKSRINLEKRSLGNQAGPDCQSDLLSSLPVLP